MRIPTSDGEIWELTTDVAVLATALTGLPLRLNEEYAHSSFVIDLTTYRKRKKQKQKSRPRIVSLMHTAQHFRGLLDTGHVSNRVEIAQREGLTRARVTQILNLLKLAPDIQDAILALPRGTPERLVTEHQLRPLIPLDHDSQRVRFREMTGLVFQEDGSWVHPEEAVS